jgi:tRNA (Thr-GGU) A37 N-methylase/3-hydroxyisobutyrate dehydrogenase-like beta-hydroxyacid dehydrogenase
MSRAAAATPVQRVAFVGFGEAGGILGGELAARGLHVSMYDIKLDDPAQRAAMQSKAESARVRACATLAEALDDAELVFSAVTASSAMDAARAAAAHLSAAQCFIDLNSVSPDTKRADCAVVEASGAAYVEAAVMAPVPPYGLAVPMLLGGRTAQSVARTLTALGMKARAAASEVGVASAVKMCRSVMIKGLEALTVESLTAARRFDAEDAVLASLAETFPGMGWTERLPDYLVSRVAEHGRRRAAEMREVTQTLVQAGVPPLMSAACAQAHDALVDAMQRAGVEYPRDRAFAWRELADALRHAQPAPPVAEPITMTAIGVVRGGRSGMEKDGWDGVRATIALDASRFGPEALAGVGELSHIEVLFHFHAGRDEPTETGSRRPRGRADLPEVGIFAQRARMRPNRIGTTVCRVLRVHGTTIDVEGLDAIDGTPVLDIKPAWRAFDARGERREPPWVDALMVDYW